MKKYIALSIVLVLLLTGCTNTSSKTNDTSQKNNENSTQIVESKQQKKSELKQVNVNMNTILGNNFEHIATMVDKTANYNLSLKIPTYFPVKTAGVYEFNDTKTGVFCNVIVSGLYKIDNDFIFDQNVRYTHKGISAKLSEEEMLEDINVSNGKSKNGYDYFVFNRDNDRMTFNDIYIKVSNEYIIEIETFFDLDDEDLIPRIIESIKFGSAD